MTAGFDLDELTRQTRRQEFVDGLNDLQTGLIFLLMGALGAFLFSTAGMTLYIQALIWNRELTILGLLALLALLVLLAFGSRRVVEYLRGQVLWKGQGQAAPSAGTGSMAGDCSRRRGRSGPDHRRTRPPADAPARLGCGDAGAGRYVRGRHGHSLLRHGP